MSSKNLRETNRLVNDLQAVTTFLLSQEGIKKLASAQIDWQALSIRGLDSDLSSILTEGGYLVPPGQLTPTGLSLFGKLLIDLSSIQDISDPIGGKYEVIELLTTGKNSATFRVRHIFLQRTFVLKVIRPGSGLHLESALRKLGTLGENSHLISPIDYFTFPHTTLLGTQVNLQCLVYPYVEGTTLKSFLATSPPLSPYFISALIEQLAQPLAELERIEAYHGDLHAENILVKQPAQGKVTFFLIDVSYGIGTPSDQSHETDFRNFQEHLWRALEILQKTLSGMSLQKHLGARVYTLVAHILKARNLNFGDLVHLISSEKLFHEFTQKREEFMRQKFRRPSGFHLLRYEEFTSPMVAVELFEPFPELLNQISLFGNALLYGHRGSGKSTYLAALACFPEVKKPTFDLRKIFGVFFACRQGEFKQYSSDLVSFTPELSIRFRHILILKVMRRLIAAIAEALKHSLIRDASNYDRIYSFFLRSVTFGAMGAYDTHFISPLDNLHSELLRNEIIEIDVFFGRRPPQDPLQQLFTEQSLIEFCRLVKSEFEDLSQTKFYLLFDDAGAPNVPAEAQRVINELVRATNSLFCVKLSAERYSYVLEDPTGKALEDPHDMAVFDISRTLFLGTGKSPQRIKVEEYFRNIMTRRLQAFSYRSTDIREYLGGEVLPIDTLVGRLAAGRRDAYFAGWEVVWQLADRTVRNLLELVNAIFAAQDVKSKTTAEPITPHVQDSAVRSVSERKLRSLSYIPGRTMLFGQEISLGRRLYEFTATFGVIAQAYLKKNTAGSASGPRFDERIAIERNDYHELASPAREFLEALIRFGILDDSLLAFARDDKMKKPLYILNRIFCPAFGISFRRNTHLRLSTGKFEQFLLYPLLFAQKGTHFLGKTRLNELEDHGLFD